MSNDGNKPKTPEELLASVIAYSPGDEDVQLAAEGMCNSCAAELMRILGEKDLEHLRGGRRIVNLDDVPKIPGYTWLTTSSLRHHVFEGTPRPDIPGNPVKTNGLDRHGAIIRIGKKARKRVLLDLDAFDEWVDEHREYPLKPPPSKK